MRGSRSGRQVFSSLTSGYEFRTAASLVSPYARVQYYRTWLDGYAESDADVFNLAFTRQTFSQVMTSAGLRGTHSVPTAWGFMKLQGRLEYSQLVDDSGGARVGYADVSDDTWGMSLYEESKQTLALGFGVDFLLPYDITPGFAWQETIGLDEQKSRSGMFMFRMNIGF
ncbi:autotransporter domain-containing protein [Cedecea colo]|uniref:Autotransporter outer membrane beta-barrel domain-containing protein n=1 Tax=Cedecea colo TaxID=2552946 RepID=A0ABX0VJL7_9ENTR|nr:autotransporter outer membrane beta-barrel domain-containing protein [Cedecea colo]NIY46800.1 autotransporter outer membrane beta-barrel domain-containing protein [Cedecea colo]